jgi:hypothetical protein
MGISAILPSLPHTHTLSRGDAPLSALVGIVGIPYRVPGILLSVKLTSNNGFGSLPTAVWALNGTGTTINLGAGGVYTYRFANSNGLGAEVWYVGDLHGVITIPAIFNLCGLTKWTLFGPGGTGVPDGGVTAILLAVAVGALALCRHFTLSLRAKPNANRICQKF